jgi:erythromycin esterase-like protein
MGAIATGGVRVLNDQLVEHLGIGEQTIEAITTRERQELERRERLYRGDRPRPTSAAAPSFWWTTAARPVPPLEEVSSWNLRDRRMAETLDALVEYLGRKVGCAKAALG